MTVRISFIRMKLCTPNFGECRVFCIRQCIRQKIGMRDEVYYKICAIIKRAPPKFHMVDNALVSGYNKSVETQTVATT